MFKKKENVKVALTNAFKLVGEDIDQDILRLNNAHLSHENGAFERDQLVKITNINNSKVTFAFVRGTNKHYKLWKETGAFSYNQRKALGLGSDTQDLEIEISPATFWETETYYLSHQKDMSARRAHRYALQGVALGTVGLVLGVVPYIQTLVG